MARAGEEWTPMNEQQKSDMVDLGFEKHVDVRTKALRQAREEQKRLARLGKPFDYRALKLDLEAKQKDLFEKGYKRKVDVARQVPVEVDLKKYAKESRFVRGRERHVNKIIGFGVHKQSIVADYVDFVSKEGGARYTIEQPVDSEKGDTE